MKVLFFWIFLVLACPAFSQAKMVIGSSKILLDLPDTKQTEKRLVIIVPAKAYGMNKPLFVDLARRLAKEGYIVARFDWGFVQTSMGPSPELESESDELTNIIATLQARLSIKKENTYIVAKSFGSRVLMRSNWGVVGHISLMTPNCDEKMTFEDIYGPLLLGDLRVNISISIDDPYCDVAQIYNFLSRKNSRVTLLTTFGDHNFKLSRFSKQNQASVLTQIINWVRQK